jgi:hypothetical protein
MRRRKPSARRISQTVGYLRWLEELGQRASSIGIWHPRDSKPAHLTAALEASCPLCGESAQDDNVGKFAVRLGPRRKPADKTKEEHELTQWPEPYIPAGERVMNIKPGGIADRHAEKKPVKPITRFATFRGRSSESPIHLDPSVYRSCWGCSR